MDIRSRIRQAFLDLIAIDGIYPYEDKVKNYVRGRLQKAKVLHQEDSFGNIIITIPGTGEPVLYSTHLDIPEPAPAVKYKEEGDLIISDGTGILGADPKSGLAVLLEYAADIIGQDPGSHVPVEILLTRGEETGLVGARGADYSLLRSKLGLVLDEDGPVTQVVTQAPAFVRIDAEFQGKIVHTREPEKGINALQMACESLMSLPWGYLADKQVTWNVGMLEAGTARNSVPGHARLKAELRSYDSGLVKQEAQKVVETFRQTAVKFGATCQVDDEFEFAGYELSRDGLLFRRLEQTYSKLNLSPNYFSTFGGSDANIFNEKGIVSVPIGSGYYNAHEYTEYVNLAEMEQIYQFLLEFAII